MKEHNPFTSYLKMLNWCFMNLPIISFALICSLMGFFSTSAAQDKKTGSVDNFAYNLTLKGLLSHSVDEINAIDASKMKNVTFLDARESAEFNISHIKGALHVGFKKFETFNTSNLDTNKTYIIYCSVGYRSEKIAEQLKASGIKKVYNLYGGIFDWVNSGLPVVNGENKPTEKVHAYDKVWGIWLKKGEKVY